VAFLGWFGPRGLASLVFGVIVVSEADLDHSSVIIQTVVVTIALSVIAHGLSAVPGARRYARWSRTHPERADLMENAAVPRQRWRRGGVAPGAPAQ
jgi:sodium/hydrogen antiporter